MRLGILLFTPILLLAGVTLHAQEAVNAPEPAAAADSAANAELKAQLKAELLSEIRAELSSEVKTAVSKEADKPSRLTVGGYGEAVMTRNFFSDNYLRYISPDKYKNDKSHGRFDLPHVVIYLGYDFGRGWSMAPRSNSSTAARRAPSKPNSRRAASMSRRSNAAARSPSNSSGSRKASARPSTCAWGI